MVTSERVHWKNTKGFDYRVKKYADEVILYNIASGDTHLIDPFTYNVIKELGSVPRSIDEISRTISSSDFEDRQSLLDYLNKVLVELHKIDIAEPVPM